jgi:hypothetical protein
MPIQAGEEPPLPDKAGISTKTDRVGVSAGLSSNEINTPGGYGMSVVGRNDNTIGDLHADP